jgi:hypothetical protein
MGRKLYTKYKRLIEAVGLKQLDVYRVVRDGKTVDIVRLYDPASGKVAVVDLGTTRESLGLSEYLEKVVDALKKQGITVNERLLERVRRSLEAEAQPAK